MRVWAAAAWDVFRRAPCRVGRGGRAAVDSWCFGLGGSLSLFFVFNEAGFCLQAKKPPHTGVRTCLLYTSDAADE